MVNIRQEKRAPRFRAYLDGVNNALFMERSEWERLTENKTFPLLVDISTLPMASLSKNAEIVGCFVDSCISGEEVLRIIRKDPKDAPLEINTDKYKVMTNFNNPVIYLPVVVCCDSCDDSDLRGFLNDYVIIEPMEKGEDHHLLDVPGIYKAILDDKSLDDNKRQPE